jgi:hypothetical protein
MIYRMRGQIWIDWASVGSVDGRCVMGGRLCRVIGAALQIEREPWSQKQRAIWSTAAGSERLTRGRAVWLGMRTACRWALGPWWDRGADVKMMRSGCAQERGAGGRAGAGVCVRSFWTLRWAQDT